MLIAATLSALLRQIYARLQQTWHTKNCTELIVSALEKYFVDLFKPLGNFCWPFFGTYKILLTYFGNFIIMSAFLASLVISLAFLG